MKAVKVVSDVCQVSHSREVRTSVGLALLLAQLAVSACGQSGPPGEAGAAAGRGGPPPAMPVEVITLQPKPIQQSTEFVGTIKSRHSITVQPQVEGFLTRIDVKSGDHVGPGAVLMEIDATSQQAAVATLESTRAARDADASYARQQAQRAKAMLDVGAASQQEAEQAASAQKAAEAQLQAVDEQIRQQRNELGYYKVTASTAGVVGDIPVRQGDRVTRATQLTTIDDSAALELYLSVPVQQAQDLKVGLQVQLLDDASQPVSMEKVTFVAPSVDDQTQTVLAKAALTDRNRPWRPDQIVRALVIWRTEPGLTIPLVSVNRINGQYFAFVAEDTPQGTVARQRAVTIGPIVGNDYVLLSGLKAGDKLIAAGVQKIGDGMPVRAGGPGRGSRLEVPVPGFRRSTVPRFARLQHFGIPEPRNVGPSDPGYLS
jgi:RND family efflux transporter MFP subunit